MPYPGNWGLNLDLLDVVFAIADFYMEGVKVRDIVSIKKRSPMIFQCTRPTWRNPQFLTGIAAEYTAVILPVKQRFRRYISLIKSPKGRYIYGETPLEPVLFQILTSSAAKF